MTSGSWPTDPASAAGVLAILICDIDICTYEDREDLLADLLSVAWPSHIAQSQ
jgi:hypothetical protein